MCWIKLSCRIGKLGSVRHLDELAVMVHLEG
jgi:hypothetical protein